MLHPAINNKSATRQSYLPFGFCATGAFGALGAGAALGATGAFTAGADLGATGAFAATGAFTAGAAFTGAGALGVLLEPSLLALPLLVRHP